MKQMSVFVAVIAVRFLAVVSFVLALVVGMTSGTWSVGR